MIIIKLTLSIFL